MNDPFEQRLSNIPRREVPPAWCEEILAVAKEGGIRTPDASLRILWEALLALLRPHPYAFAVLIALWLAIAALNLSGPHAGDIYAFSSPNRALPEASAESCVAYFRFLAFNVDSNATVYRANSKKL